MVLARTVMHAKFGKAAEVVAYFKQALDINDITSLQPRILTDISGRFDTVVFETTHESLAKLEEFREALFAQAGSEGPSPLTDLIDTGVNEYYTIEM
jgi:hypothetical protein